MLILKFYSNYRSVCVKEEKQTLLGLQKNKNASKLTFYHKDIFNWQIRLLSTTKNLFLKKNNLSLFGNAD